MNNKSTLLLPIYVFLLPWKGISQLNKELAVNPVREGRIIFFSDKQKFKEIFKGAITFPDLNEHVSEKPIRMVFTDTTLLFMYNPDTTADSINWDQVKYSYHYSSKKNIHSVSKGITSKMISFVLNQTYIVRIYEIDINVFCYRFSLLKNNYKSKTESRNEILAGDPGSVNSFSMIVLRN